MLAALALIAATEGLAAGRPTGPPAIRPSPRTDGRSPERLADRLAQLAPVRARLSARFAQAGAAYPPAEVALLVVKSSRVMELHARDRGGSWRLLAVYPVLALGRGPGPKLRRGDGCTPEGIYRITDLNPDSRFHVSLRLGYPNAFDRARGTAEGRTDLGDDIVIHGGERSVGCLAMGDAAAEELFVLTADAGAANVTVVITPRDFREQPPTDAETAVGPWWHRLYWVIAGRMATLPRHAAVGEAPAHPSGVMAVAAMAAPGPHRSSLPRGMPEDTSVHAFHHLCEFPRLQQVLRPLRRTPGRQSGMGAQRACTVDRRATTQSADSMTWDDHALPGSPVSVPP